MAEGRGRKRKEPEQGSCGSPDFRRGSICRVTMHNFMTYSHAHVDPGPWLNVVAGPNGTGKSTIICAIGLCLGGPLKSVARGDNIDAFVKTGETKGWVEVELYQGTEGGRTNLRIRLEIDKDEDTNKRQKWFINDRPSRKGDVDTALKRLGIQVDNRCAFLAQDRVREFATMSPKEILQETQKAVDPVLADLHQDLKENTKRLKDLERRRAEAKQRGDQLEEEVGKLRELLERERQREDLQEKLGHLKIKKLWVEYEDARRVFEEAKEQRKGIEREIEEEEAKHLPIKQRADEFQKRQELAKRQADKADSEFKQTDVTRTKASEKADSLRDKQSELSREIEELLEEIARKEKRIKDAEAKVRKAERDLENAEDVEPLEEQLQSAYDRKGDIAASQAEIKENSRRIRLPVADLTRQKAAVQNMLSQLENAKFRYVSAVAKNDRAMTNLPAILEWIEEQKAGNKFEGKVYGPIFAEVEAKDPLHAKYLEQALGWGKFSFVCTTLNDQARLFERVREQSKRRDNGRWPGVTVLCVRAEPAAQHPHVANTTQERKELKALGVRGFLDELVSAPPVVMQAMVDFHNLNRIACTSVDPSPGDLRDILAWRPNGWTKPFPPMSIVYTPEQTHSQSVSAYNPNDVFTRVDQLGDVRVFAVSRQEAGDLDEFKAQIARIDAETKEVDNRARAEAAKEGPLLRQLQEVAAEIKRLEERIDESKQAKGNLKRARDELKRRQADDGSEEQETIDQKKAEIARIGQQRMQTMRMLQEIITRWTEKAFRREGLQLNMSAMAMAAEAAQRQVEEYKLATQQTRAKLNNAKANEERLKKAARDRLTIAKQSVGGRSMDEELMEEIKFDELPEDLPAIDAMIEEVSVQIDVVQAIDPDTRKKFKARDAELRKFLQEQAQQQSVIEDLKKDTETKKAQWLPQLEAVVAEISDAFSEHYADMSCRGEVRLGKREEDDFESYGIDVYVAYRAESDLKVLSGVSNSGGEKSVATMLYLMCLHKVTKAPFRVVDEINQGMDIENERRVFDQLVRSCDRAAEQKDGEPQCQYFMVTPKLLPNLNFTKSITVIFPFNGAYMCNQSEVVLGPYIEKMKRRRLAQSTVEAGSQA